MLKRGIYSCDSESKWTTTTKGNTINTRKQLPPGVTQVARSDDDDDEVRAEEREDDEHVAPTMVEANV